MKTFAVLTLIILIGATLLLTGFSTKVAEPLRNNSRPLPNQTLIKQGEYLVGIMGCNDCHSPKTMGSRGPEIIADKRLSGYPSDRPLPGRSTDALKDWVLFNGDNTAAAGPWGVSFAANLTSDATGIGNWTEDQFKRALTQGKSKGIVGSRMLLPPMPWPNYRSLKDGDLKAIFAYLKSTKPVANVVPAPIAPGH